MSSGLIDNVFFQFGGQLIYETEDEWGYIFVVDNGPHRILAFDALFEQSSMDRSQPEILVHDYLKAMMLVLLFTHPRALTVLGLGGGDLVRALADVVSDAEIGAIELRPKVLDVSKKYFALPIRENVKFSIGDAKQSLANSPKNITDVIFADMFDLFGINKFQMQQQFLQDCHRVLSDGGWLVVNYHELPLPDSPFFQCVNELFPEVYLCPVPGGNFIMYAGKQKLVKPLEQYKSDVAGLEEKMKVELQQIFKRIVPFSQY